MDTYVNFTGRHLISWRELWEPGGLCNVRASHFLRPYSPRFRHLEPLRFNRLAECLRAAAISKRILHLWWHPHNFGACQEENLRFLKSILQIFDSYRRSHKMHSLSMAQVAETAAHQR
jgi:hypothetical protein